MLAMDQNTAIVVITIAMLATVAIIMGLGMWTIRK